MVLMTSQYKIKSGEEAPEFALKDYDGKKYALKDFLGKKKGVLVIFMCNHCPYVKPKMKYIATLQESYGPKGLQVVGINANDPTNYPEDGPDGMRKIARDNGFHFPYVIDETQEVAKAYGAVCTPDPFLLDSHGKLAYHGRLDDAHGEAHEKGTTAEMEEAIQQLLAGQKITVGTHPSMGCSIKWTTNRSLAAKE